MPTRTFRLLDVFALPDAPFSGNPLAVVLDAEGLSDATMQSVARQLNLSETTFVRRVRADDGTARADVRIFTPTIEMPFAGHPTLGTAAVVLGLAPGCTRVALSMPVGEVAVEAHGDRFTLRTAKAPSARDFEHGAADTAAMLGLPADALRATPRWVDTGTEQLVIELADDASLDRVDIDPTRFLSMAFLPRRGEAMAYLVAPTRADGTTRVRFFFSAGRSILEDPATGSACANLGGYLITAGTALPTSRRLVQGAHVGRPSELALELGADASIRVGGLVRETGRGTLDVG